LYKQLIHKEQGLEHIELFDTKGLSKAKICLDQGACLEELMLDGVYTIEDMYPLTYEDTYASSILFPFANRVKNGTYKFMNKTYRLHCNENGRNNALHGLVYNKRFEVESSELTSDFGSVTFRYESDGTSEGFPFKYALLLTYKLRKSTITLTIKVQNLDSSSFPFTLGWHPYFISEDLYNSSLNFKSNKKIRFDNQQITSVLVDCDEEVSFQIKDNQLDDGYVLAGNKIEFATPGYNMIIQAISQENFLQLYTPSKPNTIAIEPMTGISDSLNNELGLLILNSGKAYQVSWHIDIEKTTNNKTHSLSKKLYKA